jgi:hypothetical protein
MNNKQRKQWEHFVDVQRFIYDLEHQNMLLAANAYILKLERELQNIKGHKRIAAVLKPKMVQE